MNGAGPAWNLRERVGGNQRHDEAERPVRRKHPGNPAEQRKQHALGQHLLHDASPARAKRQPDRHFTVPRQRPFEQQAGQVGTRDQHDHCHRGEQQQRCRTIRAEPGFLQWHGAERPARIRVGIGRGQLAADGVQLRPRLIRRDPCREPADRAHAARDAAVQQRGIESSHKDVVLKEAEIGRQYADDRVVDAVERNRAAHNRGIL